MALDEEEERALQEAAAKRRDLDPMSIEELNDYIAELEAEIERVRGEIAKKDAHRAGVESLFKK